MTKIAIFSDIHFHNWSSFSSISENGLNTRLEFTIKAAKQIVNESQQRDCSAILFAGDFFHAKKIDADILYAVSEAFEGLKIPIYGVPGNHDYSSVSGEIFSSKIFSKIHWFTKQNHKPVDVDGLKIKGFPYAPSQEILTALEEEHVDIFFTHSGVRGATIGSDYVLKDDGVGLDQISGKAGLFIAGHYHSPRLINKTEQKGCGVTSLMEYGNSILIPGSPEAHNFGDVDSPNHGFWIADLGAQTLDFFKINSPRFVDFDEKAKPETYINNYVRIKGNARKDKQMMAEVKQDLTGLAAGISIELIDEEGVTLNAEELKSNEVQDVETAIVSYSDNHCSSKAESEVLKSLGLDFYHEANKANGK